MAIGLFLPEVKFVTKHPESLGKRPQGDLIAALRDLGAEVEAVAGHLPNYDPGRAAAPPAASGPLRAGQFTVCDLAVDDGAAVGGGSRSRLLISCPPDHQSPRPCR